MSDNKIIAVVGATGAQGSGMVRALLNEPANGFAVRALTRNVNSDKAKKLAATGAEVVSADVNDVGSLRKAFSGAYGAYCVTFYWEHMSPVKEISHANNLAKAAQEEDLKHVIWSTLEDTRKWVPLEDDRMPTLMDNYKVPHLDAKGESDKFFAELGVPTTYLLTSFYWDNLIFFGMGPKKGPDGQLMFTLPMGDKKLPGISADDIGKCAFGIFKKGGEYIGKTVGIAGDHLTGTQMAVSLSKAFGQEIGYNDVPPEVYRGFGFPGAEDFGNMFQFKRDFESYFCGARNLQESRSLNPALMNFDQWLEQNKDRIPME